MNFILVTNNELAARKICCTKLIYNELFSFVEVLKKTRNLIHEGHILLTHPLSGSVKPYETSFKSVVVSVKRGKLDNKSLEIIENSILVTENFIHDYKKRDFTDKIYDDFRLIDYTLIKSGIDQMRDLNIIIH